MITFKQHLKEARYETRHGGGSGLVNKALEAVPRLKETGRQVFVSKFEDVAPGDPDIFLKTYKELTDRFGEPRWEKLSSDSGNQSPYWDLDKDTYLLLHHVGLSVICR